MGMFDAGDPDAKGIGSTPEFVLTLLALGYRYNGRAGDTCPRCHFPGRLLFAKSQLDLHLCRQCVEADLAHETQLGVK